MRHVGIVTQARTTSTRLPRKVLLEAAGRTLLDHHLDRLDAAGLPLYVATTDNTSDDPIVDLAEARGLVVHRGSEADVLSRFYECAQQNRLDVIVRVTSDCPLIDGALVASAVAQFLEENDPWLYLSNTLERTFPRGFDFEIFSMEALAQAHGHAITPAEREHVTPYLYSAGREGVRLRNLAHDEDKSGYRLTVDTPDDLRLIRELLEQHSAARLDFRGLIDLLDRRPDLAAINHHIAQKALGT